MIKPLKNKELFSLFLGNKKRKGEDEKTEKNNRTTMEIAKDTLGEFKRAKLNLQAIIGEEINNDEFLKKLIKSFNRYDVVFELKKEIDNIE